MRDEPKRRVRLRIITLLVFFYLGFAGIVLRTYQLQVLLADRLQAIARQQYFIKFPLQSLRGVIYDRNLRELAVNKRGYSIAATERIKTPGTVALKLSKILGIDPAKLESKLKEDENFVWLARQVSEEQGEAVKVLSIPGITALPEERRFYPAGNLAGQVLGFVGLDGDGLEGIEKLYDKELKGRPRFLTVERDRRGALMMRLDDEDQSSQPGSLVLTIDQALQHMAEEKLKAAVQQYRARRGCIIAVDPRTGRIIAFAVYPGFDPNHFSAFRSKDWRNWPITEVYEPGSTFKVVTFAAAIEENKIRPEDKVFCEKGSYQVGDDTIHDMKEYGELTAAEVISYSSNIGAAKVAEKLGSQLFRKHIVDFGFGAKTGIDFPGEARGQVWPVKQWYPITLRTIGFGQGISATPLQMVMALAAVANGGELLRPYLAEKLVYSDGSEQILNRPIVVRRVISHATAESVTRLMLKVVNEGTGKNAAIPGYQVAGKTGTAQKSRPGYAGYEPGKWVCSFMGFAPADDPRLAMIVVIDEPEVDYATGGKIAAPIFQEVSKYALTIMTVVPNQIASASISEITRKLEMDPDAKKVEASPASEPGKNPEFKGLSLKDALKLALETGQKTRIEGSGWVVEQAPPPGSPITGKLTLKLNAEGM